MQSKNKKRPIAREYLHVTRVRTLPCSVCNARGPSEAHEIKQGQWFTSIALCPSCHRGSLLGWHGEKRMWAVKKMDELDALAITIDRLILAAETRDPYE